MALLEEINIITLIDLFMGIKKIETMKSTLPIIKEHEGKIKELINKITTKEEISEELVLFYKRYYFVYFNSLKDTFLEERLFVEKIINFTVKYIVDAFNSSDSYYTMYVPPISRRDPFPPKKWFPFITKKIGNEIEELINSIVWHFIYYYQYEKDIKIIDFNKLLSGSNFKNFKETDLFKNLEKTKFTQNDEEKPIRILLPSTLINFNLKDGEEFNKLDIKCHEKDKETNMEYIKYGEEFTIKNNSTIPIFTIIPDEKTINSMSTENQKLYRYKLEEFKKSTIPVYGYDIKNKSYVK